MTLFTVRQESWPGLLASDLTPSHSPRWFSPGNSVYCLTLNRSVIAPRAGLSPAGREAAVGPELGHPSFPSSRTPLPPAPLSLALWPWSTAVAWAGPPAHVARGRCSQALPTLCRLQAGACPPAPPWPTPCSALQPTQTPSRLSVGCIPTSDPVSPWQLAPEPLASPAHPWLPCRWEMGASRTGGHAGHPGALGRESGWRHRALGPDHCELVGVRVRGPPFIPCPELVSSPPGVIHGSPAGKGPGARPCPLASVPKDPTWPGRVGRQVLGQLMGVR